MSNSPDYQAVLWSGADLTFESTPVAAANELEAEQKAEDWTRSAKLIPENAWLTVSTKGHGLRNFRPEDL